MTELNKKFPMTDERIIRAALSAVTTYFNQHKHESVNVNACVDAALKEVKTIWKRVRGHLTYYVLNKEDIREIAVLTSRIEKELTERARLKAESLLKKNKVKMISAKATQAILDETLSGLGLNYHIIHQNFRAKVLIRLPNRNMLQFFVLYREMSEGKSEEIMDSVKAVLEPLISSGRDIQVLDWRNKENWEIN